ncbi:MAG TPA: hypothetical protein VMS64_14600 [Candidatus Methylomirabilis sp.]|nr:hypothetical protein [Candidatus Methylomirabilis sp.]
MANAQTIIATVIHDQLGQILMTVFTPNGKNPFEIRVAPNDTLLAQLQQPGTDPPRVSLSFVLDVLTSALSALADAMPVSAAGPIGVLARSDVARVLDSIRNALPLAGLFDRQRDLIADVTGAQNVAALRDAVGGLFQKLRDGISVTATKDSVSRVQQLLGNDAGTALPFATVATAALSSLQNAAGVPESVERALLDYFFRSEGYTTVDGERVVAPVHLSDVGSAIAAGVAGAGSARGGLEGLKGLFSKATGERYLRDIIRVIVESGFDTARGITGPSGVYAQVTQPLTNREKFVLWFRGFSSMAESGAMRAVELGTQGVAAFQTNPLIAASAGSFAGTVARKLAQDSFLSVVREELRR